jgi:transcriptional regulator with XRE-family HTH domain
MDKENLTIDQRLGCSFLEIRKSLRLTQTELAERMGVQANYLSRLENGLIKNIKTKTINKFLLATNTKLEITRAD